MVEAWESRRKRDIHKRGETLERGKETENYLRVSKRQTESGEANYTGVERVTRKR